MPLLSVLFRLAKRVMQLSHLKRAGACVRVSPPPPPRARCRSLGVCVFSRCSVLGHDVCVRVVR